MIDTSPRRGIHGYAAFWLGLMSLFVCAPLGLIAFVLGMVALIHQRDQLYAVFGMFFSMISLGLWVLVTVVLLSQR